MPGCPAPIGLFGTNYATGPGGWAPDPATASSLVKTYEIEWRVQDDNDAVSLTAAATLTWEAQA